MHAVHARYEALHEATGGGFDGIYCIGNSLAAAGSRAGVMRGVHAFGKCLHPRGRLLIQVLNFGPMRLDTPCVRGPRVSYVDDREYVSFREFHFDADGAQVTNVTLWNDNGWRHRAHSGRLYPVERDELRTWYAEAGLRIDEVWGSYQREPFDPDASVDLIVVATRH